MTATLTSPTIFSSPYPDLELFGGTVYEQIFDDLTAVDAARPAITELTERATPYKKVRAVTFLDEIPKNPTGKILRKDLRLIPLEG